MYLYGTLNYGGRETSRIEMKEVVRGERTFRCLGRPQLLPRQTWFASEGLSMFCSA